MEKLLDLDYLKEMVLLGITSYAVNIIAALVILIIGKWLARKIARLTAKLLEKNHVDITVINFLETLLFYALFIVVLLAAASKLGINTTSFLTVLGTAAIAIGLALKDSLSNFASGIMIIMFKYYRVGDFISAGGATGTVLKIEIFNTILNTVDNKREIVPNSKITTDVITNITANDTRRIDLVIGIGYDDDIAKAKNVLAAILKDEKAVLASPAPLIGVSELGDSSVNFIVRPWVKTSDYFKTMLSLTEKIKITFDKEGINIPYPQQDIHIHQK